MVLRGGYAFMDRALFVLHNCRMFVSEDEHLVEWEPCIQLGNLILCNECASIISDSCFTTILSPFQRIISRILQNFYAMTVRVEDTVVWVANRCFITILSLPSRGRASHGRSHRKKKLQLGNALFCSVRNGFGPIQRVPCSYSCSIRVLQLSYVRFRERASHCQNG